MRERLQKKSGHTLRKRLIICACTGLIILGGYLLITSQFRLKTIVVTGTQRYTEEEMKAYLQTEKTDQITLLMYLKYKFEKLPEIPFIEHMELIMEDKNTIRVEAYEKMVVGCVLMKDSYMYFDKDGIVVESSKEKLEGVPLVEGLKFDKIILHESLSIQKNELFTMMLNLTQSLLKYEIKVDKVLINSDYEVTLYCGESEVLLGKRDYYDLQLYALKSVLKTSDNRRLCFDLRYYSENNTKIIAKPLE